MLRVQMEGGYSCLVVNMALVGTAGVAGTAGGRQSRLASVLAHLSPTDAAASGNCCLPLLPPCISLSKRSRRYRALDEAADADLGPGGQGRGGSGGGSGGEAGFGGVEGAMVGINSVHVALSSVSAIQVGGWGE